MDDSLRARAIERLLPPLVHHLNNAIAIVQGVFELESGASALDRRNARQKLATLSTSLARLSLLARTPSSRRQVLALDPIGETCELLLRPLAQALQVDFLVRARTGVSARADARLESLFFQAAFELIQACEDDASAPPRIRLTIASRGEWARVALTASGPAGLPRSAGALEDLAHELGFVFRQRATARGTGLCLLLPRLFDPVVPAEGQSALARRVLLVQEDGQDREICSLLLREQGCEVQELARVPASGDFELVLLDERVLARDPRAVANLGRVAYRRLEHIRPPLRPAELLQLLRD